jgi:histidinol-phosphate aminotransferase
MRLYRVDHLWRLNNNENPLGPPGGSARVIAEFPPKRASIYPSGDSWYLRVKLAEKFDLDPDQIVFGNGANEAIAFVIKAFCQEGDNIITADRPLPSMNGWRRSPASRRGSFRSRISVSTTRGCLSA